MDYQKLLEKFQEKKILVIGDILLDHYIYGNSYRISPEAPVPVINFSDEFYGCGGAANVALNLKKLGARVRLTGRVGHNAGGGKIRELLKKENFLMKDLFPDKNYITPVKTRLISNSHQIARLDRENGLQFTPRNEEKFFLSVKKSINKFSPDAIILSDYAKGLLTPGLSSNIIKLSRDNGIKVIVDPKGPDFSKYSGADYITPNTAEAEQVCGFRIDSEDKTEKALKLIIRLSGVKNVLITRGSLGTSYLGSGKKIVTLKTDIREVYDVTGAGDTFAAVFTLALISGCLLKESINLANIAAGIVIQRMGTSSVTPTELISRIYKRSSLKLLPKASLSTVVNTYRTNHKRIVFTNGCFDLLHSGHVDLLQKSKELGDILIVAINSDSSIRKLKGAERPIIKENERVSVISALSCVDHVILFEDDTPIELIEMIKPDILTKGSDYKEEDVVGRDILSAYGGSIKIITLSRDVSTSSLVSRIKDN